MALCGDAGWPTVLSMIDRQTMNSAIPAVKVDGPTPLEHDAAVRTVLRVAARCHAGVADAGLVCDVLGLDLREALRRDR